MNSRNLLASLLAVAVLALVVGWWMARPPASVPPSAPPAVAEKASATAQPVAEPVPTRPPAGIPSAPARPTSVESIPATQPLAPANKLDRLEHIRQTFKELAAGDPRTALSAARNLEDETERETALMTLLTVWRQGDLSSARQRAGIIAAFGLDAGVGVELSRDPAMAVLYAEGLTNETERIEVLKAAAVQLLQTNASAALALMERISPDARDQFVNPILQAWARNSTEDALDWAKKLPDPASQDAAVKAIREVAPVGIGTQLSVQDGLPVIGGLVPGAPAELSGQIHAGDRILGIAQGNNDFVDAKNLSLNDVVQAIRGTPGTIVQLQILPADAPPGTLPRTVAIIRDQVKYKQ